MKGNPYYRAYQFFSSEMGLNGAEKDVFGVIYNAVANMKGVVSIRQIEMRAGRRRATVCKALNSLISKGYIIKGMQTAEGKNTFALGKVRVGKDQHPEWTTPVSLKNPFGSPEDTRGSIRSIPVNNYNTKYE